MTSNKVPDIGRTPFATVVINGKTYTSYATGTTQAFLRAIRDAVGGADVPGITLGDAEVASLGPVGLAPAVSADLGPVALSGVSGALIEPVGIPEMQCFSGDPV